MEQLITEAEAVASTYQSLLTPTSHRSDRASAGCDGSGVTSGFSLFFSFPGWTFIDIPLLMVQPEIRRENSPVEGKVVEILLFTKVLAPSLVVGGCLGLQPSTVSS